MQGNSNVFVVKPYGFAFSNIKRTADNFANPAASSASGALFIKAGNPFSATVSAINSSGAITPNFGNESSPEVGILNHNLVAPDAAAGRRAALALARKRRLGPFGAGADDRAAREKQIAAMLRAGHPLDSAREMVNAASVEAAEAWAAASEDE